MGTGWNTMALLVLTGLLVTSAGSAIALFRWN